MLDSHIKDISSKIEEAISNRGFICIHVNSEHFNLRHAIIPEFIEISSSSMTLSAGHFKITVDFLINPDKGMEVSMQYANTTITIDFC